MNARETKDLRARVGELLAAAPTPEPPSLSAAALAGMEAALGPSPRSQRSVWVGFALAASAAVGIALVVWPLWRRPASLGWSATALTVEHRPAGAGFTAAGSDEGRVLFADGSAMTMSPGAAASVTGEAPARAAVTVAQGRVGFRVHHRADTRWQVAAGPFVVHVTGTAFTINWDPGRGAFELRLTEGSVRIEGGAAGAGLPLVAGQVFAADLPRGRIAVSPAGAPPPGDAPLRAEPPTPASEPAAPATVTAAPPPVPPPAVLFPAAPTEVSRPRPLADAADRWADWLSEGAYDRVIADAEAGGLPACLESCAPRAKLLLADAARYRGRGALATQVLRALVADPAPAAIRARAHFLLGQIAEDAGTAEAALAAYDRCLAVDAEGGYAALALGRKLLLQTAAGDAAGAKESARLYLARHASGPHAEQARALVGGP
jgi:FecR protein